MKDFNNTGLLLILLHNELGEKETRQSADRLDTHWKHKFQKNKRTTIRGQTNNLLSRLSNCKWISPFVIATGTFLRTAVEEIIWQVLRTVFRSQFQQIVQTVESETLKNRFSFSLSIYNVSSRPRVCA